MTARLRIIIAGAVQGVGFRPFVYRLATELGIAGWVYNSPQGVVIEAEGAQLKTFLARLESDKPTQAFIRFLHTEPILGNGETGFVIRHSDTAGGRTAIVLPDLATCPECLSEIFDPSNRRYRYPFTNCTHCGPRYSLIEALPYDRPNTTMRGFKMCEACHAEYENPTDRRFHAQPNACTDCGPQLALWDKAGNIQHVRDAALLAAAEVLSTGRVVAVKGLGGFHLMVDARDKNAVAHLRALKGREEKPFAVMYPTLEMVKQDCVVGEEEEKILTSAQAPIVLLRYTGDAIAANVAPHNPFLGVLLPYTPLHHLLMTDLGFPVVATSGNLSGEPICTDEYEALVQLGAVADAFLVHNRPITRHVDDSVMRVAAGRPMMLRRARGYAPLPVELPQNALQVIAVGAHLKNTVALTVGREAFISQHIGDMDVARAIDAFERALHDLSHLYTIQPAAVACDAHPDYNTTRFAESMDLPLVRVQHHYAHVLACMAELHLPATVLGVAWDGTGYGTDSTLWGGEFLLVDEKSFTRVGHLRTFRLPGGERASREPRRSALGMLYEMGESQFPSDSTAYAELSTRLDFSPSELNLVISAIEKGVNAPVTSSAGRFFDAVAALIGIRARCNFEGQAAMELEFAAYDIDVEEHYPYRITSSTSNNPMLIIDWAPTIRAILNDSSDVNEIAAKFHNTLAEMIVKVAQQVQQPRVVLTGGCFQNKRLLERTVERLQSEGFIPYWSQLVPPNDGGIALGQLMAALRYLPDLDTVY